MISRMTLMAGLMGSVLSFGVANASVTDTNSLTAWEAATGDSTPLTINTGDTTPPGGVSFGTATAGAAISPAGAAEGSRLTYWNAGWADHGTGALATDNVIKIGNQSNSSNSVTFNLTGYGLGFSALGLFLQVNGTGNYSIYTCTRYNGANCTVDGNDLPITDSGTSTSSTGGVFFGYYGDPTGQVKSIVIQLNPPANDTANPTTALVVGQFYEVAIPEPASLGLVGFGLAALGIARRRKRA